MPGAIARPMPRHDVPTILMIRARAVSRWHVAIPSWSARGAHRESARGLSQGGQRCVRRAGAESEDRKATASRTGFRAGAAHDLLGLNSKTHARFAAVEDTKRHDEIAIVPLLKHIRHAKHLQYVPVFVARGHRSTGLGMFSKKLRLEVDFRGDDRRNKLRMLFS
jgi:hypothetical protein